MASSDQSDGPVTLEEYLEVKRALEDSKTRIQLLVQTNRDLKQEITLLRNMVYIHLFVFCCVFWSCTYLSYIHASVNFFFKLMDGFLFCYDFKGSEVNEREMPRRFRNSECYKWL